MSRGTIFYIGGFEMPDRNAAALRVLANGKILRSLGYDVVFIGIDTKMSAQSAPLTHRHEDFECWTVPYPTDVGAWLKYIVGLQMILDIIQRPRPEKTVGVICYNYPAVAGLRIRSLCKRLGAKFLSDATEWYDSTGGNFVYRLVKACDTSLRMHVVHRLADGVITTSQYLTDFYTRRGLLTVELPTLFDASRFHMPSSRGSDSLKRFIYVGSPFDAGRVNRRRTNMKERLDTCIDIFYALHEAGKDFTFDVFGISLEEYLRVFPGHRIKIEHMAGKLVFHGRKPNVVVLEHIRNSDFSIFFRDRTRVTLAGFPSKLAESLSVGTPVISNTMLSLQRYAHTPGIYLSDRGKELDVVANLISIPGSEIDSIKLQAFESRTFHYQNYEKVVSNFLLKVGI